MEWGSWREFELITNGRPVISEIADQIIYHNLIKNISGLVSVSDVNNDTITKYKVRDQVVGNNSYINGSVVDASGGNGYEFNASALGTLSIKGQASDFTETLSIAAYDGYGGVFGQSLI